MRAPRKSHRKKVTVSDVAQALVGVVQDVESLKRWQKRHDRDAAKEQEPRIGFRIRQDDEADEPEFPDECRRSRGR